MDQKNIISKWSKPTLIVLVKESRLEDVLGGCKNNLGFGGGPGQAPGCEWGDPSNPCFAITFS